MASEVIVRQATRSDAAAVAEIANAFADEPGSEVYSEALVLRDIFGERPCLTFLLAEQDGVVVGFASFQDFYKGGMAARGLWLSSLYVREGARGMGTGRRLLAEVGREAVRRGGEFVTWCVSPGNEAAQDFYRAHSASDPELRIMELTGDGFDALRR